MTERWATRTKKSWMTCPSSTPLETSRRTRAVPGPLAVVTVDSVDSVDSVMGVRKLKRPRRSWRWDPQAMSVRGGVVEGVEVEEDVAVAVAVAVDAEAEAEADVKFRLLALL